MLNTFLRQGFVLICLFFCTAFSAKDKYYLHLTSDSDFYVAGETIKLRILCRDVETNQVSDGSTYITLDLVDPKGTLMERRRAIIDFDQNSAEFTLPLNLASGVYRIYAFGERENIRSGHLTLDVFADTPSFNDEVSGLNISRNDTINNFEEMASDINIDISSNICVKREQVNVSISCNEITKVNSHLLVKVRDVGLSNRPKQNGSGDISLPGNPYSVSINPIIEDPSSRISFFYLDDILVEEVYYDSGAIKEKLNSKIGKGKVWAFQFDSKGEKLGEVDLVVSSDTLHNKYHRGTHQGKKEIPSYKILQARKRMLVNRAYGEGMNKFGDGENELSFPDYTINLSDYQTLPTVEETLKALVPKCRMVKVKGEPQLRLVPKESSYRYRSSPLIIINGVPTFNARYVFGLSVEDIEYIHLKNSMASQGAYGMFGRNGIISFKLREGVKNPLDTIYESLPTIIGLSQPTNRLTKTIGLKTPDLRNVLYWNTSLKTDAHGRAKFEFYTSDVSGEYEVYIELIDRNGNTSYANKVFSVSR